MAPRKGPLQVADSGDLVSVEPSADRTRVQFDLGPDALKQLERMQARLDGMSRAELFRTALRLYQWHLDKREDGWELQLAKDGVVDVIRLPLPGLE